MSNTFTYPITWEQAERLQALQTHANRIIDVAQVVDPSRIVYWVLTPSTTKNRDFYTTKEYINNIPEEVYD